MKYLVLASTALSCVAAGQAPASPAPKFDADAPMPPSKSASREREMALARLAAPEAVSKGATIWVVGDKGFEVAIAGTTGWGCLVQRSVRGGRGGFPRCDDPERVATLYPTFFLMEEMRAAGKSANDYRAQLADGYRTGRFHAPRPGAISYMYAQGPIPPHVMIALPNCRPEDIGISAEAMSDSTLGVSLLGWSSTQPGGPDCDFIIYTTPETARKVPPVGSAEPHHPPDLRQPECE